ncbi:MAG: hypothetical protein NVS3B10_23320 [Polyangiales bacterium]
MVRTPGGPLVWLGLVVLLGGCPKAEPQQDTAKKGEASSTDESPKKKTKNSAEASSADDDGPAATAPKVAGDFALRILHKPGSAKASVLLDYQLGGEKKTATLEVVDVGGAPSALEGGEAVTFDAAGKHAKIASANLGDGDFDEKPVIAKLPKDAVARGGVVTSTEKAWFGFNVYSVLRVDDGHVKVVRQQWQSNGDGKPETEKTFAPFGL